MSRVFLGDSLDTGLATDLERGAEQTGKIAPFDHFKRNKKSTHFVRGS